jgi:hypothetical protein
MTREPRYSVADDVAWLEAAEAGRDRAEAYVARVPEGPPLLLEGAAWAIWLAVAEGGRSGGRLDDIVARAADLTGSDAPDVADEVAGFLGSLVEAGLVRRTPASDVQSP